MKHGVIANLGRMSGENSLHRKNPAPVKKNSNTLGDSREAEEVRRALRGDDKETEVIRALRGDNKKAEEVRRALQSK